MNNKVTISYNRKQLCNKDLISKTIYIHFTWTERKLTKIRHCCKMRKHRNIKRDNNPSLDQPLADDLTQWSGAGLSVAGLYLSRAIIKPVLIYFNSPVFLQNSRFIFLFSSETARVSRQPYLKISNVPCVKKDIPVYRLLKETFWI